MKVALVLPVWDDPTLPGFARDLAAALAGRVEFCVAARARGALAPGLRREGGLRVRLVGPDPRRLSAALAQEAPDLVHYHFAGNDAWTGLSRAELPAPLLVTLHGILRGFPGEPEARRLCAEVLRRAAAVSAVSDAARESLGRTFPELGLTAATIRSGVDVSFFARPAGPRPHPRRYLLSVSRAELSKGLDILLLAFSGLARRRPDVDLLVCGPSDDGGHARRLAAALGLGERALFLGVVSKSRVARLLAHCEAMALGTRFGESYSLAILEALAAGAPVVAAAAGGTLECLKDDVNALLVAPREPDALARALDRVLGDAALRARLSAAARLGAARHDRAHAAQAYLRWYEEALVHA